MTLRAQIIIGIILLIGLAAILNMVRKRSLELKYVLVWIVCDIVLLIIIIRPSLDGFYCENSGNPVSDEYDFLCGIFIIHCYYLFSHGSPFQNE